MVTAYKNYWKNYVNFAGKSTLSDYWWVILWSMIVYFGSILLVVIVTAGNVFIETPYGTPTELSPATFILLILLGIYTLATIIPSLSLIVRRLRDGGFHWALIFLNLIPYVGSITIFVLCQFPSKK